MFDYKTRLKTALGFDMIALLERKVLKFLDFKFVIVLRLLIGNANLCVLNKKTQPTKNNQLDTLCLFKGCLRLDKHTGTSIMQGVTMNLSNHKNVFFYYTQK